jgi:peroxiredoxin family protein
MDSQQMMEIEKVFECLLAKMDANQEKAEIGHKEFLARLEDDRQADGRELKEMMMKMMDTSHKEMVTETKPERDMETMACQETTEAHLEEEEMTSLDRKPEVAEQREVPVEDATVMPVGEPKKKRRRD